MTHPEDNSRLLIDADEIRAYEHMLGAQSRDQEVADLSAARDTLAAENAALRAEVARLSALLEATEEPAPDTRKIIGMSAPAASWDQRVSEVGSNGLNARRIFADLTSTGRDQSSLIEEAIADGMLPIVSYKEPSGDVPGLVSGRYDSMIVAVRDYLSRLGTDVVAVWHHEPRGDANMTPTLFRQGSRRWLDLMRAGSQNLKVGPILNGFLLTGSAAQKTEWPTWCEGAGAGATPTALLEDWDFLGIDTYQNSAGSRPYPGERIAPLVAYLESKGQGDKPLLVGEYNGWDAESISTSGEVFLSTPTLWVACVWNSQGGLGMVLTGDRLAAFKATKADARVLP